MGGWWWWWALKKYQCRKTGRKYITSRERPIFFLHTYNYIYLSTLDWQCLYTLSPPFFCRIIFPQTPNLSVKPSLEVHQYYIQYAGKKKKKFGGEEWDGRRLCVSLRWLKLLPLFLSLCYLCFFCFFQTFKLLPPQLLHFHISSFLPFFPVHLTFFLSWVYVNKNHITLFPDELFLFCYFWLLSMYRYKYKYKYIQPPPPSLPNKPAQKSHQLRTCLFLDWLISFPFLPLSE